jgi:hypothetical protein
MQSTREAFLFLFFCGEQRFVEVPSSLSSPQRKTFVPGEHGSNMFTLYTISQPSSQRFCTLCSLWTDRQQILLHLKEETKDAIVQSRKI